MAFGKSKTQHARQTPFDNSSNGFPAAATNVQAAIESVLDFNPLLNPAPLYDDFDGRMTWSPSTAGTGAAAAVGGGNAAQCSGSHNGVARIAYGTIGVPSHAALVWSGTLSNALMVGGGIAEYRSLIRIPTLATATEDYVFRAGIGTATNADHANGIYFEYDRSQSANWRCKTAQSSTRTVLDSGVAVANNAWIELKWVADAAGTSVEFFINGVSVGTISTNIPTATGQGAGGNFQIVAVAIISGGREVFVDYFYFNKAYTSRQP